MLKVLFLCTETACRRQMAKGRANHDLAPAGKRSEALVRFYQSLAERKLRSNPAIAWNTRRGRGIKTMSIENQGRIVGFV